VDFPACRAILAGTCPDAGVKAMTERSPTGSGKQQTRQEREKRLAEQLRENLRKRKAQARARRVTGTEPPSEE
jgi:hypothetical protein